MNDILIRPEQMNIITPCPRWGLTNFNSKVTDPKQFWNYFKTIKHDSRIPKDVYLGDFSANTTHDIANCFRKHFSSVYTIPLTNISSSNFDYINSYFNTFSINKSTILSKLKNLDVKKDVGPDHIPPFFLKSCCFVFV